MLADAATGVFSLRSMLQEGKQSEMRGSRGRTDFHLLLSMGMLLVALALPALVSADDAAAQPTQNNPAATADQTTTPAAGQNPLKALLDKTGLKYKPLDEESWIVPFDAKEGKTLDVYLTYNDSNRKFALIFSTVVDKEDKYAYGKDVLAEAMKLNNDYPGVKFCLDADHGDIDVQSEVLMQTLTPEVLAMYVNLVAQMADDNTKKLNELAR